jgi:hypothetical protein
MLELAGERRKAVLGGNRADDDRVKLSGRMPARSSAVWLGGGRDIDQRFPLAIT